MSLPGPDQALRWRLRGAFLVLWVERLGIALWPAASLAALLAALALTGLPSALPAWLHALLLLAALCGVAVLIRRGLSLSARPTIYQAERRLEHDSGLRHRPFAVLRDHPAGASPAEQAFWTAHRSRARAAISRVRLRGPQPHLASADPFALRAACALLLVAGLVVAGPLAGSRLASLFMPGLSEWRGGPAPAIEAWIQPPTYTGLPPVFLPPPGKETGVISVPVGSYLTVSITGLSARPTLTLAGTTEKLESLGNDSFQAAITLTAGGRLRLTTFFSNLAAWDLALLANEAPVVAWSASPARAGTSLSTKFPWLVQQRWGVAALQAELRPKGRPDLPALTVKLPLPGTPKKAGGAAITDLSDNPYAGVMLTARLAARDVSGQTGSSASVDFILPARSFHHPLARAIADLRRRLALHPDAPGDAAADLQALAQAPFAANDPSGLTPSGVIVNLATAAARLAEEPGPDAASLAEIQGRLWILALALDGVLPDASSRALADARDKMREGLRDRETGRLSQKELDQRLDALREALDKRLADIARDAMKKGAIEKFDPRNQHLSSNAMDRLIRKMEQAAREGRMDEARQRLAELEKMLDRLNSAHVMTKQEAQQQQEQSRRGRQMLGAVQDLVRRETGLLDHALRRLPRAPQDLPPQFKNFDFQPPTGTQEPQTDEPDPPIAAIPPGDLGQADPPSADPPQTGMPSAPPAQAPALAQAKDARTQRALHRALDAMSQGFVESGGQKPKNLDEAGRAMDDASKALSQQQDPPAREAIGRAIAALQQGGQSMAQQMNSPSGGQMQLSLQPGGQAGQGKGGEEGDDEPDDGQGGRKKDPFGRQVDGNGTAADDPNLKVPDEMEQGRSRAIQDELRRRGADRERPQDELNYIERLLKPF